MSSDHEAEIRASVAAPGYREPSAPAGGQGFIILLIWVAIAIINVAYARRP